MSDESEFRSQKSEARSQKSEARSQKIGIHHRGTEGTEAFSNARCGSPIYLVAQKGSWV